MEGVKLSQEDVLKLQEILRRADSLNNLLYIIETELPELNMDIQRIEKELLKAIQSDSFIGESLTVAAIALAISEESTRFVQRLNDIEPSLKAKGLSFAESKKLARQVRERLIADLSTQIGILTKNQRAKIATIKLLQAEYELQIDQLISARKIRDDIQLLAGQVRDEQLNRLVTLALDGKVTPGVKNAATVDNLQDIWNQLGKRYGNAGYILYRGSTDDPIDPEAALNIVDKRRNYPLASYIEQKIFTIEREVQTQVSTYLAAKNGIYTLRFNENGTQDSCVFWENKVVFASALAKEQFIAEFPQYRNAVTWPTVEDVKNDNTHMLGWRCRHTLLPYPIQSFDEVAQKRAVVDNKMPKVPKKISEAKVRKQVEKGIL